MMWFRHRKSRIKALGRRAIFELMWSEVRLESFDSTFDPLAKNDQRVKTCILKDMELEPPIETSFRMIQEEAGIDERESDLVINASQDHSDHGKPPKVRKCKSSESSPTHGVKISARADEGELEADGGTYVNGKCPGRMQLHRHELDEKKYELKWIERHNHEDMKLHPRVNIPATILWYMRNKIDKKPTGVKAELIEKFGIII